MKKTTTVKPKPQKTQSNSTPFVVGHCYFIRSVTTYFTGQLVRITDHEFVLAKAAWIADTGRFATALETGKFNEVEPYPENVLVYVSRGGVIDVSEWKHPLPRSQQ